VLEFDPIRAPALAGGKQEPVARVSYLGGPAPVLFRESFAASKAVDDALDLQEFGFGILSIFGARERPFSAGPQFGLEVADVRIGASLGLGCRNLGFYEYFDAPESGTKTT
jgi:hypothetical protein